MRKFVLTGCGIVVFLSGCAKDIQLHNANIMAADNTRFSTFTTAMNQATDPAARMAISNAYFSGAGTRRVQEQETILDYIVGIGQVTAPWIPWILGSRKDESQAVSAGRDVFINSPNQHDAYESAVYDIFTPGDTNNISEISAGDRE